MKTHSLLNQPLPVHIDRETYERIVTQIEDLWQWQILTDAQHDAAIRRLDSLYCVDDGK